MTKKAASTVPGETILVTVTLLEGIVRLSMVSPLYVCPNRNFRVQEFFFSRLDRASIGEEGSQQRKYSNTRFLYDRAAAR